MLRKLVITILLLTVPFSTVFAEEAQTEEELPPVITIVSAPASVTMVGNTDGTFSETIEFNLVAIPDGAEVTAAQLSYLQEGNGDGILRITDGDDIIDAKTLNTDGPKQVFDLADLVNISLSSGSLGLELSGAEMQPNTIITLSTIQLEAIYTIPDEEAPVFEQVEVFEIGSDTASFYWELSEQAEVTIQYGKTSEYGEAIAVKEPELFNEFKLTDLSPGTSYHYILTATDPAGNKTQTRNSRFTTSLDSEQVLGADSVVVGPDVLAPPSITLLELDPEDPIRTVYVTWRNLAENADGFIVYRSSNEGASYREIKRVGADTLTLEDTGISPSTTYYYALRTIRGNQQSELSGPLAIYVPDVIGDQISISSEDTVDAIGRTTLVLIAGAGLALVAVILIFRKLFVRNKEELLTKKKYTRNVLRDPEYYSDEFS